MICYATLRDAMLCRPSVDGARRPLVDGSLGLAVASWSCLPRALYIGKSDCDTCDYELRERRPLGSQLRAVLLVFLLKIYYYF